MTRLMDPFAELDRFFNTSAERSGRMPMDAYEKDGVYTLRFDLAGADPENVDVTVEHGMLTVTAMRAAEDTDGANWLLRERPTGRHSRQIRLGDRLDTSNVEAQYDHGVLTITIPIRAEAKPQKVQVTTGSQGAIAA